MPLIDKLKTPIRSTTLKRQPVWAGPSGEGANGGITFSLLNRYLSCSERFRIHTMEGLKPADAFNARLEYGSAWHVCEEAFAAGEGSGVTWQEQLKLYCRSLCRRYPMDQEQVDKWYNVILKQFPLYVEYWAKNDDVKDRTPLEQERKFDVSYKLPSGRRVRLRGKRDAVDLIGTGKTAGIFLQENKTKGEIDPEKITRQLTFDMQTMTYLVALNEEQDNSFWRRANKRWRSIPIRGIRYNIVRRPLSGGKGTIVRHKATKNHPAETEDYYYNRLADYIKEEPHTYFMRWKVEITPDDIKKFKRECLDPILENVCDDYEWWEHVHDHRKQTSPTFDQFNYLIRKERFPNHTIRTYRLPFGIFNPIMEGYSTDLDEFLSTGSTIGLQRETDLFPELK